MASKKEVKRELQARKNSEQAKAVAAVVLDEIASARQQPTQAATVQPAVPAQPAQPATPNAEMVALQAQLAEANAKLSRQAFDILAVKRGIPEAAHNYAFAASQADKPADLGVWMDQYKTANGIGAAVVAPVAAGTSPTAAAPSATAAAPVAPVAPRPAAVAPAAVGAPVQSLTANGLPDIWNYTAEQIAMRGPMGMREDFEKILGVARSQTGQPPRPKIPGQHN